MRRVLPLLASILFTVAASGKELSEALVDIEPFFDGLMATHLADGRLVGAVVAVVNGNSLVLAKGYGDANRARNERVDPDRTLFRIGSVSELFVWLAVMQEVEAGHLALEADVNDYLGTFEIPRTQPGPVTIEHLMTHTPGFEDRVVGLFAPGPRTMGAFHGRLTAMLPRRIFPPGQLTAYSNYGSALAAYLVERVSGMAWDDYVEVNILEPLDIRHTTTRQPVPDGVPGQLAQGYVYENGRFEPVGFEFIVLPPAGSVSASAADMARLMFAYLNRDPALLGARGYDRLFETAFRNDQRLNGMAGGFFEYDSHGQRIVGHSGDAIAFHSQLLLYPERGLGLFIAVNSDRGQPAVASAVRAFNDRLFGRPSVPAPPDRVRTTDRYVGWYLMARSDESSPARLLKLINAVRVRDDAEGHLLLPGDLGERQFYEAEDNLFQQVDGGERLAFDGGEGKATRLFIDSVPAISFVRAEGFDDPMLNIGVLTGAFVVLVSMVVWPLSTLSHTGRTPVGGEGLATLTAVANVGLIVSCAVGLAATITGPKDVVFGLPQAAQQLMWLPVVSAVLVLPQVYFVFRSWVAGYWWWLRRLHYSLVALAVMALIAWMFWWRLTAIALF